MPSVTSQLYILIMPSMPRLVAGASFLHGKRFRELVIDDYIIYIMSSQKAISTEIFRVVNEKQNFPKFYNFKSGGSEVSENTKQQSIGNTKLLFRSRGCKSLTTIV